MDAPPPIVTQHLEIVDSAGRPRLVLSARSVAPYVRLLQVDGRTSAELTLAGDYPVVKLENPGPTGPTAALEVDDKGAHVKFDGPGKASSYLFLNNSGGSGVVLIDRNGVRRLDVMVGADGEPKVERFGADGKLLP